MASPLLNGFAAAVTIATALVDVRVLRAASYCGRSLVYGRLDIGSCTVAKLDVELVAAEYRTSLIEVEVLVGPVRLTNRSWYGVGKAGA
jgi:hypothetical protein